MKQASSPAAEEEDSVRQSLRTLSDSISRVQILKGKWSLAAAKVNTLLDRLSDLSAAAANSLSADLLRAIAATSSAAAALADACRSPNPPGGKLKTQNDVDSISAKLDAHINDLQVLVRSDAADAATAAGRREPVRSEARNLLTRLQIGSNEYKSSVLDSLLGLLQEDDKHIFIAAAYGVVPILVNLLDSSSSSEIKEKTVTAIARISAVDSNNHLLSAEGLLLLNNLLRVLESGSVFAKEKACVAIKALSNSKENARAIVSRGGISSLLEICLQGTPNSQALAAGVLRSLSAFEEIKNSIIEENAVPALLILCNSGTAMAQENSYGCFCNLLPGNDELKLTFAREGGIESLTNFWDCTAPSVHSLEVAVTLIRILSTSPIIADVLLSRAFLDRVVRLLSCGVLGVRIAAARALPEMAYNSKLRKELGAMGCISLLVGMLDGKAVEEREAAAMALLELISYAPNRRILRKEEKGIICIVQLLDPSVKDLNREYPLSILSAIVHDKKCRKMAVVAGARLHLQKLVDANVAGAKKVLDGLRGGGPWGVFGKG
ncbi:ARM REPEAT PROTEIN INTERACTING WITH ABF2-like [Andrographis paniculata]|uniref:ARM REPEAT PROTEIN INTERACTING WITH ABF2-like n=1 Tax=Andrographis paniculata TaxID=175694 RepID=UPI0021E74853|nr:ARM REPEAT PROTEIN INTERACTING WITH ABF2-like [Andrographis paniculata]